MFRSTISRRVQYALWLLVALRLLVPAKNENAAWQKYCCNDYRD